MKTWQLGVITAAVVGASVLAESVTAFTDDFSTGAWADWKAETAVARFSHNQKVGNEKPGSLQITVGPGNPLTAGCCFVRHVSITPGRMYTALVYVRGTDLAPDSEVTLGFQGQDSAKHFLGTGVQHALLTGEHVPSDGWKRLVFSFIIPETGKWSQAAHVLCTFGLSNTASGQVFFDDFEFFEADE